MRNVLNQNNAILAQIFEKARYLSDLNTRLLRHIEPELAAHCQIANFAKGVLHIEVDSANWGTKLRYQVPDLLKVFRSEEQMHNLINIKTYINPPSAKPRTLPSVAPLSAEAKIAISAAAESTTDEKLKAALRRLASRS